MEFWEDEECGDVSGHSVTVKSTQSYEELFCVHKFLTTFQDFEVLSKSNLLNIVVVSTLWVVTLDDCFDFIVDDVSSLFTSGRPVAHPVLLKCYIFACSHPPLTGLVGPKASSAGTQPKVGDIISKISEFKGSSECGGAHSLSVHSKIPECLFGSRSGRRCHGNSCFRIPYLKETCAFFHHQHFYADMKMYGMNPFVFMSAVDTCGQLHQRKVTHKNPKRGLFCQDGLASEFQAFLNLHADDQFAQREALVGMEQKGNWLKGRGEID
ncbi:uncharacterized protein V6R79_021622 [Siganus canaliculatus]